MNNSGSEGRKAQFTEVRRLIASKSYEEAEKTLLNMVKANPEDARAWYALGDVRYKSTDYGKAVEAYQRCLGITPDDPRANYSLGVSLNKVGRIDEAKTYLKRALVIKPDFHEAEKFLSRLSSTNETNSEDSVPQTIPTPPVRRRSAKKQKRSTTLQDREKQLLEADLAKGVYTQQKNLIVYRVEQVFNFLWSGMLAGGLFGFLGYQFNPLIGIIAGLVIGLALGIITAGSVRRQI